MISRENLNTHSGERVTSDAKNQVESRVTPSSLVNPDNLDRSMIMLQHYYEHQVGAKLAEHELRSIRANIQACQSIGIQFTFAELREMVVASENSQVLSVVSGAAARSSITSPVNLVGQALDIFTKNNIVVAKEDKEAKEMLQSDTEVTPQLLEKALSQLTLYASSEHGKHISAEEYSSIKKSLMFLHSHSSRGGPEPVSLTYAELQSIVDAAVIGDDERSRRIIASATERCCQVPERVSAKVQNVILSLSYKKAMPYLGLISGVSDKGPGQSYIDRAA